MRFGNLEDQLPLNRQARAGILQPSQANRLARIVSEKQGNFAAPVSDGFLEGARLDHVAAQIDVAIGRGESNEAARLIQRFDLQPNS